MSARPPSVIIDSSRVFGGILERDILLLRWGLLRHPSAGPIDAKIKSLFSVAKEVCSAIVSRKRVVCGDDEHGSGRQRSWLIGLGGKRSRTNIDAKVTITKNGTTARERSNSLTF